MKETEIGSFSSWIIQVLNSTNQQSFLHLRRRQEDFAQHNLYPMQLNRQVQLFHSLRTPMESRHPPNRSRKVYQ